MTTYVLNEEKMFVDIAEGLAIVINSETGIYFGMNILSTAIFEKIIAGYNDEAILQALKQLPNAPEDLAQKFNAFVEDLKNKGLIMESSLQNSGEVVFGTALLNDEGFAIAVTEYNDAQELLQADPIHEVKEGMGWTPEKESIGYSKEETKEREKKMVNNG